MAADDGDTIDGGGGAGDRETGPEPTRQGRAGQSTANVRQAGSIGAATERSAGPSGRRDHRGPFEPGVAFAPTAEPAYRFVPDNEPDAS